MPALHSLPFTTFASIVELGLEVHVYCSKCYTTRRIDPLAVSVRERQFVGARFACRRCDTPGLPAVQPRDPPAAGGDVTLVFMWCNACMWEAKALPIDEPPWNLVERDKGGRFRCPGCRKPAEWHIHEPAWAPDKYG